MNVYRGQPRSDMRRAADLRSSAELALNLTEALLDTGDFGQQFNRHVDEEVRFDLGPQSGIGRVELAGAALADLTAFEPGRVRLEEMLGAGAPGVAHLSQRRSVSTRVGPHSRFGETGGVVSFRILTDLRLDAEQLTDIVALRDTAAILAQLGQAPRDWARRELAARNAAGFTPEREALLAEAPPAMRAADQWSASWGDLLTRAMGGAFTVFEDQYDDAAELAYPGGLQARGGDGARAFWLGLRAALPSGEFEVLNRIGAEEPLLPARAALRWRLSGTHDGWGAFGAPSGATLRIEGISHAEFGPNGIRRDWTLYDAAAVWMQIAAHTG